MIWDRDGGGGREGRGTNSEINRERNTKRIKGNGEPRGAMIPYPTGLDRSVGLFRWYSNALGLETQGQERAKTEMEELCKSEKQMGEGRETDK